MRNLNSALLSQGCERLCEEELQPVMFQSVVADHGLGVPLYEGAGAAGQHEVRTAAALREERLAVVVGEEVVEEERRGGGGLSTHHTPHLTTLQPAEALVDLKEECLVLSHQVKAQLAQLSLSSGTDRTTELHNLDLSSPHLNTTIKTSSELESSPSET